MKLRKIIKLKNQRMTNKGKFIKYKVSIKDVFERYNEFLMKTDNEELDKAVKTIMKHIDEYTLAG